MSRGHDRERAVKRWLQDRDWLVIRAAGSLGFDLIALRAGSRPRIIEVKSTARGPYAGFPPADRRTLILAGELADADVYLAWWPPRGSLHWIGAAEWPVLKAVA